MGPRRIKKRRPASCPKLPDKRPNFTNYMKNINVTTFVDTPSERYWSCGHFEYNNSSIRSFWSDIWAIELQIIHNLAILRRTKSDFIITWLLCCDKTIHVILLNFFVVLDIGLVILNLFLFCKYLINPWNGEKPRIMLFYVKKTKKVTIHSNFAEFSRTAYDPKVIIMVLKCSLKC